jgi:L-threonylcarbamoyladenylate synthase
MYSGELQRAARILKQGGIVAYATEYCFGLGCDPFNRNAVLRLLRLKRRPVMKGLIVLAANNEQLTPYLNDIPPQVAASWPGPHTWLLVPRPGIPGWITGRHANTGRSRRIAVRVTAHAQAAALCQAAGMAIISTSANRAGESPARSDREAVRRFGKLVDCVLRGSVGEARMPTPIRDAITDTLVRPG